MPSSSIADLRREYRLQTLDQSAVSPDPIEQFSRWWQDVMTSELSEPNGMTLATATPTGKPSARIVLLKSFDQRGFVFYSNYESRKGQDLAHNPQAALVFWWDPLERQVRIEGTVKQVDPSESDAYFQSRPRGSQIGAWASNQSQEVSGRETLEQRYRELDQAHAAQDTLPRPSHWGGYRLVPTLIEFWQGRPSRLHDRICYIKSGEQWILKRLSP